MAESAKYVQQWLAVVHDASSAPTTFHETDPHMPGTKIAQDACHVQIAGSTTAGAVLFGHSSAISWPLVYPLYPYKQPACLSQLYQTVKRNVCMQMGHHPS